MRQPWKWWVGLKYRGKFTPLHLVLLLNLIALVGLEEVLVVEFNVALVFNFEKDFVELRLMKSATLIK